MTKKINQDALQNIINANIQETLSKAKTTKSKKEVEKAKATKTVAKTEDKPEGNSQKKQKVVKEVAKQVKTTLIEQVVSNREVKYKYPDDVTDTLSKKAWRQKVRNKLDKLERDMYRIKDQNSKEFKAAKKAYEDYRKTVLKEAV